MSKVSQSDPEILDEISEDAIVAQQTGAHVPQRRVKVQVEARSVVVAEAPPAERALEVYDATHNDPTVVVRDRHKRAELLDDVPTEFRKKRSWGSVVVWVLAAATAFAAGGLISVLRRSGPADAPSASAGLAASPGAPAAPMAKAAAAPSPAASEAEPAVPAVDLDELPVEHQHHVAGAPHKAAASRASPAPAKPVTHPAAKAAAIPEGI